MWSRKYLPHHDLTPEEKSLIRDLEKLAVKWRKHGGDLWLFSASWTLHVMLRGDTDRNPRPRMTDRGGVNPDNIVASIDGLEADGGDWD